MSQAPEKKNNNNRNNKYHKKERHAPSVNKEGVDIKAGKPNPKNFKGGKKNLLDDSKEQAELKAIYDKINAEKKKITEISEKIQAHRDARKGNQGGNKGQGSGGSRKKELLDKKKELFQALNHLKAQRTVYKDQLDAIKLPLAKKKDQQIEDYIAANLKEYNTQIATIEKSIQFETHSLAEEKKKIGELEKAKKARGLVDQYRSKHADFQQVKDAMKEKSDELQIVKTELDEIFNSEKANNEEADKRKKTDEEKKQYYQSLIDTKNQHQATIKQLLEQAHAKKEEIDGKWAVWKKDQAVLREKRKEEHAQRQIEWERQQKEYQENKLKRIQEEKEEREREEALKLPFSDDITRADFLLSYLAGLRYPKNKPNLTIKHSIDCYIHFEEFSISPPAVVKDIESVRTKINEKKADLLEKQKAEIIRREEQKKSEPAPQENQASESEVKQESPVEVKAEESPSN